MGISVHLPLFSGFPMEIHCHIPWLAFWAFYESHLPVLRFLRFRRSRTEVVAVPGADPTHLCSSHLGSDWLLLGEQHGCGFISVYIYIYLFYSSVVVFICFCWGGFVRLLCFVLASKIYPSGKNGWAPHVPAKTTRIASLAQVSLTHVKQQVVPAHRQNPWPLDRL